MPQNIKLPYYLKATIAAVSIAGMVWLLGYVANSQLLSKSADLEVINKTVLAADLSLLQTLVFPALALVVIYCWLVGVGLGRQEKELKDKQRKGMAPHMLTKEINEISKQTMRMQQIVEIILIITIGAVIFIIAKDMLFPLWQSILRES
jgi:hypothetical protein